MDAEVSCEKDTQSLLKDHAGRNTSETGERDQDGEPNQNQTFSQPGSPTTHGDDDEENAVHDEEDTEPHILLSSPPNDSVDSQHRRQRDRDPLLTPQVVKPQSLVDSPSPYIMTTTKSPPDESSISLTNKNM